ncbi:MULTISPECIES: DMT family transporter [unclassified Fibrobacter]|uniref:DMT family transporter n=1 Tax=unclassified Fibrobacter TaxID=2634177 RepID=UPI000D6D1542|nr:MULTISPECIES: DMT family transporter [unclassified Fibrobacter]PWJ63351.1 drug/metabolite transporter (DMT)-like permease [Fibrobacter sp. UWR4]PZW68286.1 drug/metabolite transporter (DMT)-like permease [Fibrobacter sp. UWR1]
MQSLITAHICIFLAAASWGLMAPIGKDAMMHGITGLDMVFFRVAGAAVSFWTASLVLKVLRKEPKARPPKKDILKFAGAGLFAIVCNQCCFTVGLSITSPINASIVATSLPIFALISSAIFLKERITLKKILGIGLGLSGALMLVLGSVSANNAKAGNIVGDLLCMTSQCSFAIYLGLFKNLISKYDVITCMKWMFTFSTLMVAPLTLGGVTAIPFAEIAPMTWAETGFVVFGGTFIAYLLMAKAQKALRPTVVAMYNYVQPIVSAVVSVLAGLALFGFSHALAILLIVAGVYTVNSAKTKT